MEDSKRGGMNGWMAGMFFFFVFFFRSVPSLSVSSHSPSLSLSLSSDLCMPINVAEECLCKHSCFSVRFA